ncbi:MAG: four helix bundle protein [Phycisphaerales bacterium]|nr:four helix bundle protein [Phycisphaerales bacterium]
MTVNSYQDLRAWQHAFVLAKLAYDLADRLPDYERFALSSQIRRAATSIFGNIAEGYGAGTRPKFLNHLRIARGSARELDSYVKFVRERQPSLVPSALESAMDEACRVLQGLIATLEISRGPRVRTAHPRPLTHDS